MTVRRPHPLFVLLIMVVVSAGLGRLAAASSPAQEPVDPELLDSGRELYAENCQPCHGDEGAGDGPSARFLEVAPRDLTEGMWMYIEDGSRESIAQIVADGIEGTDMEPFDEILTEEEIAAIAVYVVERIVPDE